MMIKFSTLSMMTAALCVAIPATADTWGGGTGSYTDGAMWLDGTAPAITDVVTISSGEATLNANLNRRANTTLNGTGSLIINGRFLNGDGGGSTFTVEDDASLAVTGNYFIVQLSQNFASVFNQNGGSVTATIDRGWFSSDGNESFGNGTYNANGGTATFNMVSTSSEDLHNVQVGRGSSDFINVNGGSLNFVGTDSSRRFYLSRDSQLDVSSGSLTIDEFRFFIIGYGSRVNDGVSVDGTAVMDVSGGIVNIDADLVMGDGQSGTLNITGGSLEVEGLMSTGGDVKGSNGSGLSLINHSAGSFVISESLYLQDDSGGTTEWNMSGGTLTVYGGDGISLGSANDAGLVDFNFTGGIITLTGDKTGLLNESWFNADGAIAQYNSSNDITTISFVPEPGSIALLGLGGLIVAHRRRRA